MSHNITFRYIVLLRYTDEGICDKQSRKAIELGGRGSGVLILCTSHRTMRQSLSFVSWVAYNSDPQNPWLY